MDIITKTNLESALLEVLTTIKKCEKMQDHFEIKTSQHTLLINRIHALNVSKALLENQLQIATNISYTIEDFNKALPPIQSIIQKCEKAIAKFQPGHSRYTVLDKIIQSMYICKTLIIEQIQNNEN